MPKQPCANQITKSLSLFSDAQRLLEIGVRRDAVTIQRTKSAQQQNAMSSVTLHFFH
jgi:hypothetical protein